MARQLQEAVETGQNEANIRWIVEGFLSRRPSGGINADISSDLDKSDRALHLAVRHKRLDIVTMLVEEFGANIRLTTERDGIIPLELARKMGSVEILHYLQNKENIILLREAIEHGNVEGFNQLIPVVGVESNIAPHIRNQPQNYTALHYAAKRNQLDVVRILLTQHGANILARNAGGQTPVEVAVDGNYCDIVRIFVEEFGQDTTNLAERYRDRIHQMLL